jgi:condensin complex subunit 2
MQSYTPKNQTKSHSNFLFQDKENNENLRVERPVTFSDLYAALPSRLPSKLAENLSAPLAIVALLHLANEKTLDIEGNDDLSDLIITQSY